MIDNCIDYIAYTSDRIIRKKTIVRTKLVIYGDSTYLYKVIGVMFLLLRLLLLSLSLLVLPFLIGKTTLEPNYVKEKCYPK